MKNHLLLSQFMTMPWALEPAMLATVASVLLRWDANLPASHEVIAKITQDQAIVAARKDQTQKSAGGNLAVIPLYGILMNRPPQDISGNGGTSMMAFAHTIRQAAADDTISHILLDIDSPGGSVFGMVEAANAVYEARQSKPVIAIANGLAASAAYFIGSQATEFYVTPSGQAGSIGVYTVHQCVAALLEKEGVATTLISAGQYKTEGNPFTALTDEAKAAVQAQVDIYYRQFVNAVARGRGVAAKTVTNGMGQGRCLTAELAVTEKLADGIATLDKLIAYFSNAKPKPSNGNANARRRLALAS